MQPDITRLSALVACAFHFEPQPCSLTCRLLADCSKRYGPEINSSVLAPMDARKLFQGRLRSANQALPM